MCTRSRRARFCADSTRWAAASLPLLPPLRRPTGKPGLRRSRCAANGDDFAPTIDRLRRFEIQKRRHDLSQIVPPVRFPSLLMCFLSFCYVSSPYICVSPPYIYSHSRRSTQRLAGSPPTLGRVGPPPPIFQRKASTAIGIMLCAFTSPMTKTLCKLPILSMRPSLWSTKS